MPPAQRLSQLSNQLSIDRRSNQLSIDRRGRRDSINDKPPSGLHYHLDELRFLPFKRSVTGKPWTGKFRSLLCLVENPYETGAVYHRRSLVVLCGATLESTPECERKSVSRVSHVKKAFEAGIKKYKLSDYGLVRRRDLFYDDIKSPLDMVNDMNLRPFFHSYVEQASWDDFRYRDYVLCKHVDDDDV